MRARFRVILISFINKFIVSSVSTPVSVHKENLQNSKGSEPSKKPRLGSSSSSHQIQGPAFPSTVLGSTGSSYQLGGKSTVATALPSKSVVTVPPPSTVNAHSTRFSPTSEANNSLVLNLYSVLTTPQQSFSAGGDSCNCTVAVETECEEAEGGTMYPSAIEESILETFQRIDAQHVSNSFETGEDERKMSIIENPLSDRVLESSSSDVTTIPYQESRAINEPPELISSTPSNYQNPYVKIGSEMMLLNNRVDELTK